jgi:ATP/ADP translocase
MNYVIPSVMICTGVIVGVLIGVGRIDASALLLVAPMVMFGVWIFAVMYVKRRFNGKQG